MAIIKRDRRLITGLADDLTQISSAISLLSNDRALNDGDLSLLTTTQTTSLAGAINELVSTTTTLSDESLTIEAALFDVSNVVAARTNLDVYSTTELNIAILSAQEMLGSNHNVTTIAERDVLTGLNTNDRVFVADTGSGLWAIYKPTTIVDGTVVGWTMLMDAGGLARTIDSASIRAAYLENADTNVFSDVDQGKLVYTGITQARNLDDIGQTSTLIQDLLSLEATSDAIPSAEGVVSYINAIVNEGGPTYLKETITVVGDTITLTQPPLNGVHSIMNFATVRYTDMSGVSYDAPITPTQDPSVFTVNTGTPSEWDALDIDIHYVHETIYPTVDETGYADQGTLPEPA